MVWPNLEAPNRSKYTRRLPCTGPASLASRDLVPRVGVLVGSHDDTVIWVWVKANGTILG